MRIIFSLIIGNTFYIYKKEFNMKTSSKVLAITLGKAAFALTTSATTFASDVKRVKAGEDEIERRHTAKNSGSTKTKKTTTKGKAAIRWSR